MRAICFFVGINRCVLYAFFVGINQCVLYAFCRDKSMCAICFFVGINRCMLTGTALLAKSRGVTGQTRLEFLARGSSRWSSESYLGF